MAEQYYRGENGFMDIRSCLSQPFREALDCANMFAAQHGHRVSSEYHLLLASLVTTDNQREIWVNERGTWAKRLQVDVASWEITLQIRKDLPERGVALVPAKIQLGEIPKKCISGAFLKARALRLCPAPLIALICSVFETLREHKRLALPDQQRVAIEANKWLCIDAASVVRPADHACCYHNN